MQPRSEYRPDVDGLRALAVGGVLLFHAGFDAFGGGFIGVDVFFVISGFLITSIVLREQSVGSFTLDTEIMALTGALWRSAEGLP